MTDKQVTGVRDATCPVPTLEKVELKVLDRTTLGVDLVVRW